MSYRTNVILEHQCLPVDFFCDIPPSVPAGHTDTDSNPLTNRHQTLKLLSNRCLLVVDTFNNPLLQNIGATFPIVTGQLYPTTWKVPEETDERYKLHFSNCSTSIQIVNLRYNMQLANSAQRI
jgi:hypothetical protein